MAQILSKTTLYVEHGSCAANSSTLKYSYQFPELLNKKAWPPGSGLRSHPVNLPKPLVMRQTHSIAIGYLAWIFGCFGAHRFYFGKPLSGLLWLFTFGLLGIGWIVDLFLIPAMEEEASRRFVPGSTDYTAAWLLLFLGGVFGLHRFYMGDILWGLLYLLTGGLFVVGVIYDVLTLNDQVSRQNYRQATQYRHGHPA